LNNRHSTGWLFLALVLGIGLVHGALYVFLVPPWQHNDEPNHFEYAWLVAHRASLPRSNDSDPGLSHAVMVSMAAHHFFDHIGYFPDLTSGQSEHIVGWSQLTDPPLYYLIASIPIKLATTFVPNASIESQLYAARLSSLALLVISLMAAWGLTRELTGPTNPLRWLVPLTLALWPGFIDLMTAVSNHVGAVAFFSLFLWFGVRLIRRGLGWLDFSVVVLSAAACLWTLNSMYSVAPLFGAALLFALFRKRSRWCAWGLLLLGVITGLLAIITWGDADVWYRETWQAEPSSKNTQSSPLGKKALQLVVPSQSPSSRLYQLIPPPSARNLEGKTVTLGAWIWATHPLEVNSPILVLSDGFKQYSGTFRITETPVFHAITATLAGETRRSWIILSLPASIENNGVGVFFDGVVLAEGSFPLTETPVFDNQGATHGLWGGHSFTNLVRNPSAEMVGPRIRLWIDRRQLLGSFGRLSMILYAVRDLPGTGWYFRGTAANLVRTLWGRFGWNHVSYLGHKPYRVFLVATILGLVGGLKAAWRIRKNIPWELLVWLGMTIFIMGGLTIARGVFFLWFTPFIPSARYLYPAMPVIVFILCTGWWEWLSFLTRWLRPWVPRLIYISLFLGIDIYALVSLAYYYY
jgi:hypothetical protein